MQCLAHGGSEEMRQTSYPPVYAFCAPKHTYPNHAILTPCDDDVTCIPHWPLYYAAACYGSFRAPGCGNTGQGLSIDIPQGQMGSSAGNNGSLQQ